jgi:hypothetical protein
MIIDRDTFRAAELLVERYGDEASSEALRRAEELAAADDSMGCLALRQIAAACRDLLNTDHSGLTLN